MSFLILLPLHLFVCVYALLFTNIIIHKHLPTSVQQIIQYMRMVIVMVCVQDDSEAPPGGPGLFCATDPAGPEEGGGRAPDHRRPAVPGKYLHRYLQQVAIPHLRPEPGRKAESSDRVV